MGPRTRHADSVASLSGQASLWKGTKHESAILAAVAAGL